MRGQRGAKRPGLKRRRRPCLGRFQFGERAIIITPRPSYAPGSERQAPSQCRWRRPSDRYAKPPPPLSAALNGRMTRAERQPVLFKQHEREWWRCRTFPSRPAGQTKRSDRHIPAVRPELDPAWSERSPSHALNVPPSQRHGPQSPSQILQKAAVQHGRT
ncbi:hypothetical protein SKAU_G00401950 [Synaphobranchus kaupii]|uniref:Uncharacterized protein n=1 Tax=Synaphobranchus kaupii TaxID=118154 RepID=A0A9Q1E981_SYNKA|nr:hypothetical protein SKAU_G00401950 [Synaphobranchus kaupii]